MKDTKIPMDKILLIGDTIIDVNTEGTLLGTSSETPTLVLSKNSETVTLGGAALVHRNLQTLKCDHQFITGINKKDDFKKHDDSITYIPTQKKTTIKHRFWCKQYKLLQVDTNDNNPITLPEAIQAHGLIHQSNSPLIAISDYRHGFLSSELINLICTASNKIILDSQVAKQPANHHLYRNLYLTLLNEHEVNQYIDNLEWNDPDSWKHQLFKNIDSCQFIIKFGQKGCIYITEDKTIQFKAKTINNPVDTTGAGDAFLAALLSRWNDKDLTPAIKFATDWATRSIMVKGANPPNDR